MPELGGALIGRGDELARVQRALDAGRAVAVVGPAGIGKTALAVEAVTASGRTLRRGGAVDYLQSRPFLPLTRVLGRPPSRGDSAAMAAEVRDAIGDAVLLLDDLQWSDGDTVELLPALAATGPLVVTIRPGGDCARCATKHIETIGEVVELGPLHDDDALLLARRWSPHNTAPVVEASGGNPLAIEVLSLARTRDDDSAVETLFAFIESCPLRARRTLARLSLQDPTVDDETDGLGDLVDRRLVEITPTGLVIATADLFAELALASLDADERSELHRVAADRASDPGQAARHWLEAGDKSRAFEAANRAAEQAPTAASRAQLLVLAARAAPDDQRWPATRAAVTALLELGQLDATRQLVAEVDHLEPPTRADAIDRELMRARLALDEKRFPDVIRLTDAALADPEAMTPQQHSSMLVMRAAARGEVWDVGGALDDATRARDMASDAGLDTFRADMLLAVLGALTGSRDWRARLASVYRRAMDEQHISAREVAQLHTMTLFFDGEVPTAMKVCDEVIARAHESNNRSWECEARATRAIHRSVVELSPPDVIDTFRELLADPALGDRGAVTTMLAIAEADRGHIAAADALVGPARADAAAVGSQSLDEITWAAAEVAWNAGRAEECLEHAVRLVEHASPVVFGKSAAAVLARWAHLDLGGDPSVVPQPLVVFRVQRGFIDEAQAIELLATPGKEREAAVAFLRAAERHGRYLKRNALRCRWAAGESLRRAGYTVAATTVLAPLVDDCNLHGFDAIGNRVVASLRLAGSTPTAARTNGNELTARERRVLALVREGLSTADIAARLRLRPSTVDSHVRKAMRRLGASSRREAALRADER